MRVSTAVFSLACLVIGYALAGTRVRAVEDQASRFPATITVGTTVSLTRTPNPDTDSMSTRYDLRCTIAAIDGGWFRCASKEDAFNKPPEIWYDLAHVSRIVKLPAER